MKKNLFLIGAGDFGREMESWLELLPDFHAEWQIAGYLDQNPKALDGYPSDYKIVGSPLEFQFSPEDYALMCISNGLSKQLIANHLRGKVRFFTYIAPNTIVGKFSKIMEGTVIAPNCVITTNVVIGEFVTVNLGSQIGHDCVLGDYTSLMANVDIGGHVNIGKRVFIGTNATIIPGRTVSDDITIGSGSIVIRNLKQEGTYFGNPARLIS